MLRYAAAGSITAYQKWLSPRKGFCCAYGRATGLWTCSSYAKHIVKEHGTVALARAMPRQFARCRAAQTRLVALAATAAAAIPIIGFAQDQAGEEGNRKPRGGGNWDFAGLCDVLNCAGDIGNGAFGSCSCDL